MRNENLTREIAAQAVSIVAPAVKKMLEQKLIEDMNICIVIAHPSAIVEDKDFESLCTTNLGDLGNSTLLVRWAKLNAITLIHQRDLLREYPEMSRVFEPDIPVGAALKGEIIVGVFGVIPKQFNQLIADMIAEACNALCYKEESPLPNYR